MSKTVKMLVNFGPDKVAAHFQGLNIRPSTPEADAFYRQAAYQNVLILF